MTTRHVMTAGDVQAVMDAVRREVIAGAAWDELAGLTLEELCDRNQDALVDDLYEDDPRDRDHTAGMIAHVRTYDRLLGTDRASEVPGDHRQRA